MSTNDDKSYEAEYAERKAEAKRRYDEAVTKLGGKPGKVDLTRVRVGDRYGYLITAPSSEQDGLEIVIRAPLDAEVAVKAEGIGYAFRTTGAVYPEEVGMSRDMCRGLKVEEP